MALYLTELVHRAQDGDREAADALYAATYADLRRIAHSRLRVFNRPTLLDTGSLVHESFIRFAEASHLELEGRSHFMYWAARAMRSIIVDFARRRLTDRRGGGAVHVAVDGDFEPPAESPGEAEIVGVHQALERIAAVDPRLTRVVEMKYFAGMTEPEIAQALGVTERTVRRDWQKARLLLRDALA